jgi:serine/threonine-protein kinase
MSSPPRSLGKYDLGALIGRGGMSEVYEARHRVSGDLVALKVLRSHLANDAKAVEAFAAEATRTRAIVHPNVVEVRDFGHDDGAFYLVMERLEGETLGALLKRAPLEEARARELGAAIADGVAAAHAQGIVHRDLKPGNVVLVAGVPKIVDFGIARYVADDDPVTTGTRIGTPAYMAPEQLAGGLIAPCIDVWALGVVLFEMVTGRVPFDTSTGASPQLVAQAPRLGATVSASFAALVASCLEKEPGRRPRTMADVARDLRADDTGAERLTEDLGPAPSPAESPVMPPAASSVRRRRWIAPVFAIALGVGGAIAWRAMSWSSSDAQPAPAVEAEPAKAEAVLMTTTAPPPASGSAAIEEAPAPVVETAAAPTPKRKPTRTQKPRRGSASPATGARAGETLD